jgi:chaperonin cofactor prefoldin
VNRLKKEKEDLGLQVDDLKRKNEVIQESIKQKIKGSVCSWA